MYEMGTEKLDENETINLRDWKPENFSFEIQGICNSAQKVLLTGSKYIVDDILFTPNDIDIMLLVGPTELSSFTNNLYLEGFEDCGDGTSYDGCDLYIVRKGQYNLMITDNVSYFNKWVIATEVAKVAKLTKKEDRVAVFKLITNEYQII